MKKYNILIVSVLAIGNLWGQKKPKTDWFFEKACKKNMGISVNEAYQSAQGKLPSTTIVVAVIDGGTDVNHVDLKDVIWVNKGEIPNNGIDDDKNGYVDDVNGWNFIGGKDGSLVGADNLEKVRIYKKLDDKYKDVQPESIQPDNAEYNMYIQWKTEIEGERELYGNILKQMTPLVDVLNKMKKSMGKSNPTLAEIESMPATDMAAKTQNERIVSILKKYKMSFEEFDKTLGEQVHQIDAKVNFQNNPNFDSRKIVGDNYANSSERYYGNNNVVGPDASHGTHVAGIIAATRNNNIGMNGIADNVKIMVVRVVPDGDERDKDVANGIRYAVDNGAKIINMSFGKGYRWDKNIVDSAVAYAESKNVLLVHAAGNNGSNNDTEANYPNDTLWNGKSFAANWLEIGASQPKIKIFARLFQFFFIAPITLLAITLENLLKKDQSFFSNIVVLAENNK
jgi:subtilisin family serine protease